MRIVFDATRPVNPARLRRFGLGLGAPRPARPPVGPSNADRAWAAINLNADAPASSSCALADLNLSPDELRALGFPELAEAEEQARLGRMEEAELDRLIDQLAEEGALRDAYERGWLNR